MHFITFPVATTNIFPLSNSKQGGQLVTEYNLKSRESVATNPDVKYTVGPSFIHSLDDFKVKLLEDSDVEEYDATKTYDKGDYCTYENNTYICITKTAGIDEFTGNGSTVMFVLTQTVDSVNSVTIGGLAVTDYSVDTSHNAIVFTTAPAIDADIVVDYEIGLPLLHNIPFDSAHWSQTVISTSIIQVDPGRAVINGHYVETLAPMTIDLQLANAELKQKSQEQLYGNLSIGIKAYFSTETTMAGAMLVENTENMYLGIQLVIEKTANFKTPNDCPSLSERDSVTADIKLADFTYVNGNVSPSSISINKDATRYIPSARIYDFNNILDDKYVSSENLIDRMFYTYSGKSGWCDSTGSLMVWDAHPELHTTTVEPTMQEAAFVVDTDENVHLRIPHKQQDGIINDNGDRVYYADKSLQIPTANYSTGTPGIVTSEYTQKIKDIASVINTYKQFTNGKQIMYLDTLTIDSEGNYSYEFPKDLSGFNVGDYILVREDYTIATSDDGAAPSTMYFVLPGGVVAVSPSGITTTQPSGVRLGNPQVLWDGDGTKTPTPTNPTAEELLDMFSYTSYRGTTNDYFELIHHNQLDTVETSYYYPVSATGPKTWSDAVLLTGGIPLATENLVGGFYNASTDSDYVDAGYVYLDDTGHLRLRDYSLLRSGTLAYQLGESFSVPSNQTLEYIQGYLDENVNARVAFYTNAVPTSTPMMIDVYIPLPEEAGTINIYNIDSRFGTGVYIHFFTDKALADYSNIIINIADCQKIRIDNSITTLKNGPMLNIFRSCLYYDANLIDYVRNCDPNNVRDALFEGMNFTGFEDMTLWYARFSTSDPDLIVNGMEISQPNVAMTTQDITFWDDTISNDNHYSYALRSITLSNSGKLIGCSLYVTNNTTYTVNTTQHIIIGGDFVLPQGSALNYPKACIDSPIKVTGTFTTAYRATVGADWIVTETSFTAQTGVYSKPGGMANGSIAFNSSTSLIPATYTNVDSIDGWEPGSYHIFYGGTTV
jgi:hypothetical protein